MLRVPKTYVELNALACSVAGMADPEWNLRFRQFLQAVGLALTSVQPERNVNLYPGEQAYTAPKSYGALDDWPAETWIVWR